VILYLDTSALVKLYVEERGSSATRALVEAAGSAYTVLVSYVEARAAFARMRREGALSGPELRAIVRRLDEDWRFYGIVEVSDALVRRAGALAEKRALRAFDSIQLAAALEVRDGGAPLEFVCFDDRLRAAARAERLAWALA
jgi:predicted nucleic acid-binding protein